MKNNKVEMNLGGSNGALQNKYEFLKGFAHKVETSLVRYERMTAPIVQEAVEKGIVIVYAEDDEKILFLGAKNQQVISTMLNSCEQIIKLDSDGTALDDAEDEYSAEVMCYRYSFGWSWLFKLERGVQYEIFNDKIGGVNYCQGIVFYLEDLITKNIIDIDCKEEYGFIDNINNFKRKNVKVIVNRANNKTVELALESETECPLVIAQDRVFVLDWLDILALAMKADLFCEEKLDGKS